MSPARLGAAVVLAGGLFVAPVVTPAWAAPRPVPPSTQTTALAGIDVGALVTSPPAFDPRALRSTGANAPAAAGRASAAARPVVLTRELDGNRFAAAGVTWKPTSA